MVDTPARKFLRAATPIVVAVFVVSATTGVLLFFHVGERLIKELHEWIGVVFVVAAALHIARNARTLAGYGRKPTLWIAAALVLATAAAFIVPAMQEPAGGGNDGIRKLIGAVQRAPLEEVAPLLDTTPAALVTRLESAGLKVAGTTTSLADIAAASGRPPREVLELALAGLPAPPPPGGR
jgi:hypothetical protein